MRYSDSEIKKMFPDLIAEIKAMPQVQRGREIGGPQTRTVPRVSGIEIKMRTQTGMNPLTNEPTYRINVYPVGPFTDAETVFRTDNIPKLSKEHRPIDIIRAFLEHDGHKDDDGNLKNFTVEPVDPELLKLEKKALTDPKVKKELDALKGRGDKLPNQRLSYNSRLTDSDVPVETMEEEGVTA